MKKAILMSAVMLFSRLLAAEELDLKSLVGKDWYGVYMNGQKAGYSANSVDIMADGQVKVVTDMVYHVQMAGVNQKMTIFQERVYAKDGALLYVNESIKAGGMEQTFAAKVSGDELLLTSVVAGQTVEKKAPKPKESLNDALKQAELVQKNPAVGKQIAYSYCDPGPPMYGKEISGICKIAGVEERVLDGAKTKVYRVESTMEPLGLKSTTLVAENGKVLEDQMAGMVVLRLEPKEVAQDTNYSNDVIVSNAAIPDKPVENPRTRESLHLELTGPLADDLLLSDDRQTMKKTGGDGDAVVVDFVGKPSSIAWLQPATLPVADPELKKWQAPTMLVQSDDQRLIDKTKEIVGDQRDPLEISNKLCEWVYRNVKTTYSAQLSNSLDVLLHPEGDCTEHSILFIGLARAAGLPAREAAGLIYQNDGFYFHQWASVWVGKWIDVDPTFNQPLADATHIKLSTGDLYEQVKLIPVIGKLKIKVLPDEPKK